MMKVFYFVFLILLILGSCASNSGDAVTDSTQNSSETNSSEIKAEGEEIATPSETEIFKAPKDTFKGEWFKIDYPSGFTVDPDGPIDTFDGYEYVTTDEATFTSPDKTVSFFVYSPQWSGNPENYLSAAPNEKIESDKTTIDEIDPSRVYRWITFADKAGMYTRSVYSKTTESTHLVFGIKYNDQEVYEMYKEAYTEFKKSLVQYAD